MSLESDPESERVCQKSNVLFSSIQHPASSLKLSLSSTVRIHQEPLLLHYFSFLTAPTTTTTDVALLKCFNMRFPVFSILSCSGCATTSFQMSIPPIASIIPSTICRSLQRLPTHPHSPLLLPCRHPRAVHACQLPMPTHPISSASCQEQALHNLVRYFSDQGLLLCFYRVHAFAHCPSSQDEYFPSSTMYLIMLPTCCMETVS